MLTKELIPLTRVSQRERTYYEGVTYHQALRLLRLRMTFGVLLRGLGSELTCFRIGGMGSPLLGLVECSRTKKQEL